jgi:hypothetical protein
MKPEEKVMPFEKYLNAFAVSDYSQLGNLVTEQEAEIVFSTPIERKLSDDKVASLLSRLNTALSQNSVGSLISNAISDLKITEEEVQEKTGLSSLVLEEIKGDMIFTNSIPVKSFVKLLKMLNLPLANVKAAIDQTFEKLSIESRMLFATPAHVQPAFRKGSRPSQGGDFQNKRADESYLYQNKEALEKYTRRLEELFAQA